MGYENLPSGFRIDQPSLGIANAPSRFAPPPWAGLRGFGLGAVQHMNSELPAMASRVTTQVASMKLLLDQISAGVQQYGGVLQGDPAGAGALGNAQGAQQSLQASIDRLNAVLPGVSTNHGSFQGSTDAWNTADAALQEAATVVTQARSIPTALATEAARIQRAAATAEQQGAQARIAADQAVTNAVISAQSLAGAGNFDGALAALQNPTVTNAAQLVGRAGDIQAAVAAVNGAKRTADAQAQAGSQAQSCATQGGTWTGTYCDMSAVNARNTMLAQQKAACAAQGGVWNAEANFCDISGVLAARRQAELDMIAQQRQAQLDAQAAERQARMDALAAETQWRQQQFEAQQAAAERAAAAQQASAEAAARAQVVQACMAQGGTPGPDGSCDLTAVRQQQEQQRLIGLLPFAAGNQGLMAQVLARLFGIDPSSISTGVPGEGGGIQQGGQMSPAAGGYAQNWGPESF